MNTLLLYTVTLLTSSISSYHIGNSLTNDGLGNTTGTGPGGNRKFALEAVAELYGHPKGTDYTMGMHVDASQSLEQLWAKPDGQDGIDVVRTPFGSYSNALPNYEWDVVTLEPYVGADSTFGTDKESITSFFNLTHQNPANSDTVFYMYQVWPRQSWAPTYDDFWTIQTPNDDETPTRPTRAYYQNLMNWTTETFAPQGVTVREIPTGEVWDRVNVAIESGELAQATGVSLTRADLYRDDLHSSQALGRYLDVVTQFATLFQTDIRDLQVPRDYFTNTYPQSLYDELNTIIWDVVTHDPFSGVTSPQIEGDFNHDGNVDGEDLLAWESGYGSLYDGRSFLEWQRSIAESR